MTSYTFPAPAKLNLFLHITARRENGYHELQSIFQFLDQCDQLTFTLRGDGEIHRVVDIAGVAEEDDLTVRAARLLQQHTGCQQGVDIDIDKQLPMGGGLGGGSSDAATVLVALNQLWQTRLSLEELAALGVKLGADVPIFVFGSAAWAEGVGEKLEAVEVPEPCYLVIKPPVHVSTAVVFGSPDLQRDQQPITMRDFLAGSSVNICEPVVRANYPEVDRALNWLAAQSGAINARMTGTGACVFAQFTSVEQAEAVLDKLSQIDPLEKNYQGFVARGLNRSPLHKAITDMIAK